MPSLYKYIKFHRLNGYVIFAAVLAVHGTAVWRGYAGFKAEDQVGSKRMQVQKPIVASALILYWY